MRAGSLLPPVRGIMRQRLLRFASSWWFVILFPLRLRSQLQSVSFLLTLQ